jgi:hypothetical protein
MKTIITFFGCLLVIATLNGCKKDQLLEFPSPSSERTTAKFVCGPFDGGYCTNYVDKFFNEIVSPSKKDWTGNAEAYYRNASANGWEVSADVTKGVGGAIAVWSGNYFGHVARCIDSYSKREIKDLKGKVTKTYYINIDEYNWSASYKKGATDEETTCYKNNAITLNYGIKKTAQIEDPTLNRGSTYKFIGYVFPRKVKKK